MGLKLTYRSEGHEAGAAEGRKLKRALPTTANGPLQTPSHQIDILWVNGAMMLISRLVRITQVKMATAVLVSFSAFSGGTSRSKPVCTRSLKI